MTRYPWVPDYLPSDGKRPGSWICPFCDGLILAPQSPRLHVKADHPDDFAKLPTTESPDASFDDPVLAADPAPTWPGGLLGTDRPENVPHG